MRASRRMRLALLAILGVGLLGLTLSAALRDTTPPKLYLEVETRQAAGRPLNLFASADEPVTYRLSYGDQSVEIVGQDHTFELPVLSGVIPLRLEATDAAGNSTVEELTVTGVAELQPRLVAPTALVAGDPLGIRLYLSEPVSEAERASPTEPVTQQVAATDLASAEGVADEAEVSDELAQAVAAQVSDVLLTFGGETVPTEFVLDSVGRGVLEALVATPMAVEANSVEIVATVIDEFGRAIELRQSLLLEPLPVEVEQLRISAAVLSVITPEAQVLERQVVADAWAAASSERLWTAPFRMPIAGVNTSGFGDARRYQQGGPVSYHYGLDLASPQGAPVHATNAGRVLASQHLPIKGGFIIIDHGAGLMSYYLHQSKLLVEVGEMVAPGDVIGEVGSEGLSTGPHLHWEMRVRGVATNPLAWVDRAFPGLP